MLRDLLCRAARSHRVGGIALHRRRLAAAVGLVPVGIAGGQRGGGGPMGEYRKANGTFFQDVDEYVTGAERRVSTGRVFNDVEVHECGALTPQTPSFSETHDTRLLVASNSLFGSSDRRSRSHPRKVRHFEFEWPTGGVSEKLTEVGGTTSALRASCDDRKPARMQQRTACVGILLYQWNRQDSRSQVFLLNFL